MPQTRSQKAKSSKKPAIYVADSQEVNDDKSPPSEETPFFNSLEVPPVIFPPPKSPQKKTTKSEPNQKSNPKSKQKPSQKLPSDEEVVVYTSDDLRSDEVIATNNDDAATPNSPIRWLSFIKKTKDIPYYSAFSKDGIQFRVEDCVFLERSKPPYIGQIQSCWEDEDEQKLINVRWFFRPQDTKQGTKPYHGTMELLESDEYDDVLIDQIKSKVYIETSDSFRERTSFPNNVYYYRDFYNPSAPETAKPVTRYTQSQSTQHTQALLSFNKKEEEEEFEPMFIEANDMPAAPSPSSQNKRKNGTLFVKDSQAKASSEEDVLQLEEQEPNPERKRKTSESPVKKNSSDLPETQESQSDVKDVSQQQQQRKSVKKQREIEPDPFASEEEEPLKERPKLFVPDSDNETEPTQPNKKHTLLTKKKTSSSEDEYYSPDSAKSPTRRSPRKLDKSKDKKIIETLKQHAREVKQDKGEETIDLSTDEPPKSIKRSLNFTSSSSSSSDKSEAKKSSATTRQQRLTEVLEHAKMKQQANKLPSAPKMKATQITSHYFAKKDTTQAPSSPSSTAAAAANEKKRIFLSNYLSDNEEQDEYDSDKALGAIETVKVPEIRVIPQKPAKPEPKLLKTHKPKPITRVDLSAPESSLVEDIDLDEEDLKRERKSRKSEKKTSTIKNSLKVAFIPELVMKNQNGEIAKSAMENFREQQRVHQDKMRNSRDRTRRQRSIAAEEPSPPQSPTYEDDENLEGFVCDDDEIEHVDKPDALGVEDEIDNDLLEDSIELKTTLQSFATSSTSLKKCFDIYMQFLVSCCIEDDFMKTVISSKDSYFMPSIRKVEDAVQGRKEFLLRSSIWDKTFREDLERFPRYRSYNKTISSTIDCQVCHRKHHTASFEVVLEGHSYDSDSLWKNKLMPELTWTEEEEVTYSLGRFCKLRTEIFHQLQHFKFNLLLKINKKLLTISSSQATTEEAVNTLLDNKSFMDECYHDIRELVTRADEFGREGLSEND